MKIFNNLKTQIVLTIMAFAFVLVMIFIWALGPNEIKHSTRIEQTDEIIDKLIKPKPPQ